jgi:hypothetical protein
MNFRDDEGKLERTVFYVGLAMMGIYVIAEAVKAGVAVVALSLGIVGLGTLIAVSVHYAYNFVYAYRRFILQYALLALAGIVALGILGGVALIVLSILVTPVAPIGLSSAIIIGAFLIAWSMLVCHCKK